MPSRHRKSNLEFILEVIIFLFRLAAYGLWLLLVFIAMHIFILFRRIGDIWNASKIESKND